MESVISLSKIPLSSSQPPTGAPQPSVTLCVYLAAVATAVAAGMPKRSWVEATVAAAKSGPYGHALQLVDPAGGSSAPTMRAFLRTTDRDAIARRLGAPFDPAHLVGMTAVVELEPEFHGRWGMGGRIVGLSQALRESLMRRALDEVRARLKREGLFDRQRRLPFLPDVVRVTVVHPAGAAGHADVAGELARWQRFGIVTVNSVTAAFEGPRAAIELVAALRRAASGDGVQPDVLLLVRGGGDFAGLMSLDTESVARAVCLCPVPVIVGIGHATDRSLVDEVAAYTADTPSKALARLAAMIAEPARRAMSAMAAIDGEADRRGMAAAHALDTLWGRIAADAERHLAAATALLSNTWTAAQAGMTSAGERCAHRDAEAARLIDAVIERAPRHLDALGRALDRLGADTIAGLRHRLGQADDGRASLDAALTRAGARVDTAKADIDRKIAAIPLDAARRLTDAGVDLARLSTLVESLGLDATLRRGFALATRSDGTLVPTRAAALAARDLTLTFVDGAVTARVGATLTTTILNGEAA